MGNYKSPTKGRSGGKRGYSNMEHWIKTEELKNPVRRSEEKKTKILLKIN